MPVRWSRNVPVLWGWTFLAWGVFTVVMALQFSISGNSRDWLQSALHVGSSWLIWPLVGPLFYWVTMRWPLEGGRWLKRLPGHGLAVVAAVGASSLVHEQVGSRFPMPDSREETEGMRSPRLPRGEMRAEGLESEAGTRGKHDRREGGDGHGGRRRRHGSELHVHGGPRRWFFMVWQNGVFAVALLSGSHALYFSRRSSVQAQEAAVLSASLMEARLKALSMQLQPHFLFNALNSIASLMHENVERADEMLVALSDFLRMVLYAPEQSVVSLEEELRFVRKYLEIEKVRFGDRLEIQEQIPEGLLRCRVPFLMLQPIVENAFRHAFSKVLGRCVLRIEGEQSGGVVKLRVVDNGPGLVSQNAEHTGLANVRGRVATLFGEVAVVRMVNRGGCAVELEFPEEKR